jgi:hypothetical protein
MFFKEKQPSGVKVMNTSKDKNTQSIDRAIKAIKSLKKK